MLFNFTSKQNSCPQCGAKIDEGAKFCTDCGCDLAEALKKPICPQCGTENEKSASFCKNCGAKLSALEQSGSAVETPAATILPKQRHISDTITLIWSGIFSLCMGSYLGLRLYLNSISKKIDNLRKGLTPDQNDELHELYDKLGTSFLWAQEAMLIALASALFVLASKISNKRTREISYVFCLVVVLSCVFFGFIKYKYYVIWK